MVQIILNHFRIYHIAKQTSSDIIMKSNVKKERLETRNKCGNIKLKKVFGLSSEIITTKKFKLDKHNNFGPSQMTETEINSDFKTSRWSE